MLSHFLDIGGSLNPRVGKNAILAEKAQILNAAGSQSNAVLWQFLLLLKISQSPAFEWLTFHAFPRFFPDFARIFLKYQTQEKRNENYQKTDKHRKKKSTTVLNMLD